jgi:hypothetical protein
LRHLSEHLADGISGVSGGLSPEGAERRRSESRGMWQQLGVTLADGSVIVLGILTTGVGHIVPKSVIHDVVKNW